jgi:recombinase
VDHKGERQKVANMQRAARGEIGWASRPFGYRLDAERRIVIDKTEAREIRKAVKALLAGTPASQIIADWNRRGIRTTMPGHGCPDPGVCVDEHGKRRHPAKCPQKVEGGQWQAITLKRVLTNPRLVGRAVSNGVDYGRGSWPAILDADSQAELAALYANRHRRPNDWQPKYLLSGIALCGACAEAGVTQRVLTSMANSTGHPMTYRCGGPRKHLSRRVADVDRVVAETLVARLSRRDALRLFVPTLDLDGLRRQITELRTRRDRLAEMLADGVMSADAVQRQAKRLTTDIDELARKIAAAEQGLPPGFADSIGSKQVRQAWEHATLPRQRELVDVLMTVTIKPAGRAHGFDPDQIQIDWRH